MPLSPETVAQVRQRYADGVPVGQICKECDISNSQVYRCVDGGPAGPDRLPPLARRRTSMVCRAPRPGAARRTLVKRLWRSARKQVEEVAQRLTRTEQAPLERERDMRMLAVLVKTLRELTALDQAQNDKTAKKDVPRDDDDAVPRDLDELRRELAQRVDLLRQRRTPAGSDGGAAA